LKLDAISVGKGIDSAYDKAVNGIPGVPGLESAEASAACGSEVRRFELRRSSSQNSLEKRGLRKGQEFSSTSGRSQYSMCKSLACMTDATS
jgi:hypothetical protein